MQHSLMMVFEKSTKNTHKFAAVDPGSDRSLLAFREIYIQKIVMPHAVPSIKVTVEVAGA